MMRVLLLNPEDFPFDGPWAKEAWNLVVDFGWAGSCTYAEWSKVFRCPVYGLWNFGEELKNVGEIREALQIGRGQLVDEEGIDWWDLMAPARFPDLQEQSLLNNLKKRIPSGAEVRASRPHRLVGALETLLSGKILSYAAAPGTAISRVTQGSRGLRPWEMLEVALDKWDADYGLRRFLAAQARESPPAERILLPSSYVNVSRVLLAYASTLPDRQFLLVTTRSNGELAHRPANVAMESLATYAPIPRLSGTEREIKSLTARWKQLKGKLLGHESWRAPIERGCYEIFPYWLRIGLRVCDAWRRVIERESIAAVLCGDENNPFNRLPVLLAKNRNIAAVSCSHGALDVNLLLRGVEADVYLAHGEMERDYLLRRCAVPPEWVEVGAPRSRVGVEPVPASRRDQVVLFSEPYELYSGRLDLFYGEILPPLVEVARAEGKKVVIKLHPFESLAERTKLVNRILPVESRLYVDVTNETLTDAFLDRTWFALTVESSVAVDCALRDVPCFLCSWFELGLYGYGRQYEQFGAARMLRAPREILGIPENIKGGVPEGMGEKLVRGIAPERLDELLRTETRGSACPGGC